METINKENVKTLSMVKLGENYYALTDVDAVHKNELKKAIAQASPTAQVTKSQLQTICEPVFYETLTGAVADINAETLGSNAVTEDAVCNVAVYANEDGGVVVVLLSNVTENTVTVEKPLTLQLNGYTLTLNPGTKLVFNTGADCTIDGRVAGSTVKKEVTAVSTVNEYLVDTKCDHTVITGGTYRLTVAATQNPVVALLLRDAVSRVEDCTVSVKNQSGSGMVLGIQHENNLVLSNCQMDAGSDTGICLCVQAKAVSYATWVKNCRMEATAQNNNACCVNALGGTLEVADCALSARVEAAGYTGTNPFTAWAINHRNTTVPEEDCSMTVTNSELLAYTRSHKAATISQNIGAQNSITGSRLYAASETGYAIAVINDSGAGTVLKASTCFADAANCESDAAYSRGIENSGVLKVENCAVYGTHSGMLTFTNSVTWISGGIFEGVGCGGIYLAHTGGQLYAQDAVIANARYRGSFKSTFDYDSAQYHAAGLYFGSSGVSNTAAYLDNCKILGSTGTAIVMRGTEGEQNNSLYLSNCEVTGSTLRIDNDTHKIYVGRCCNIQPAAQIAASVVETGDVYYMAPPQLENAGDIDGAA